jgi:DNA-binding CsgD family transcriptional regulator
MVGRAGAVRVRLASVGGEAVAEAVTLRPIERVVRRLVESGVDPAEVAWRLRRSPRSVKQILELSGRAHSLVRPSVPPPELLRPIERRILALRAQGAGYAEIGARFRHSPAFIRRIEEIARAKAP